MVADCTNRVVKTKTDSSSSEVAASSTTSGECLKHFVHKRHPSAAFVVSITTRGYLSSLILRKILLIRISRKYICDELEWSVIWGKR